MLQTPAVTGPQGAVVSPRSTLQNRSEHTAQEVAATNDIVADALYYRFFDQAERVRWRIADIPWYQLQADSVSEYWKQIVAEIARSELTTFDGTHQFMTRFGKNADFSQWLAVWFYEETKHPQALMLWLDRVGVQLDHEFLVQGRSSPQFAASWLGTLTLNVIAELLASEAYLVLSRYAPEPVLRHITQRIAADEARHAAHFFAYGQRLLARTAQPELELKNGLEVLYLWLNSETRLDHPVGAILNTIQATELFREGVGVQGFVTARLRQRVCQVIGRMLGFRLESKADVVRAMRDLIRTRNASRPRGEGQP
ncbi:MAG TPA: ferritin-like domain-containing protein [Polyangiaceae bacterium]|nr:ferritin-like domain-containing protein [Polyangiaceae bacterium]